MPSSKFSEAHLRPGERLYWLISKEFLTIDIGVAIDINSIWIPGFQETKTVPWVATHFYIIEMKVPNEILKFKAPSE